MADLIPLDARIPAALVRHCSLPWYGVEGRRNDGRVIRLSTWDDARRIRNIYLVADDAKTALMLVSHVVLFTVPTGQGKLIEKVSKFEWSGKGQGKYFFWKSQRKVRENEKLVPPDVRFSR